jgi:hypothetical protein
MKTAQLLCLMAGFILVLAISIVSFADGNFLLSALLGAIAACLYLIFKVTSE